MARLPQPGGDSGNWGTILNDYLSQAHKADGTLKDGSITATKLITSVQTSLTKADSAVQPAEIAAKYVQGQGLLFRSVTLPDTSTYSPGIEYIWFKTDGSGNVLDILSGVTE